MSVDNVTPLPRRGHTLLSGANRTLSDEGLKNPEGTEKLFADYAPQTTPGAINKRSNRMVRCILVRNVSDIALLPKRIVKWKSGYEGRQVDGYCTEDHERCAGVVDEHLPAAGVPDNDCFWLVVQGPTLVLTDLAGGAQNVWAAGQIITALTAVTSQSTTAGRARPFAVTTNTTNVQSIAFNRLGRAMSAKTTTQTNADLLVDLNIMT